MGARPVVGHDQVGRPIAEGRGQACLGKVWQLEAVSTSGVEVHGLEHDRPPGAFPTRGLRETEQEGDVLGSQVAEGVRAARLEQQHSV